MESIWQQTAELPRFPALSGDIRTDVLIIGGGMAGILTAYYLEQTGITYVLAEAETVAHGITGNTTAKLTAQHGLIYDTLIRRFGTEKAAQYLTANREALAEFRALCKRMDCGYEEQDSWVYSVRSREKIEREISALLKIGFRMDFSDSLPLPFPVAGAIRFPRQAQFHPLQFLAALLPGLRIYEHTRVTELRSGMALTPCGRIFAQRIVAATHFPFLNKHGAYYLKLYQHRSYVLALKGARPIPGMYVDEDRHGMSFRSCGDIELIGGGGHRTGKKGGGWQDLRTFAAHVYPDAREVAHWAAQDCMTLDGVPYIGRYSARTKGLYVMTGFNKWGMTQSMAAALHMRDLLMGKKSPYQALYSTQRSVFRPQLAVNALEALLGLLTPTARRCPHLGCALHWNSQEHTWDCGCHGSRFAKDGKLLDNPATGDLK